MEAVKMENENKVKEFVFEFESNRVCIVRKESEPSKENEVFNKLMLEVFELSSDDTMKEYNNKMNEENKVIMGPYARDVAKTLVYQTSCVLGTINDTNYMAYIKED